MPVGSPPAAPEQPIQVQPSPIAAQAASTVRVVVLIVTGAAAIIGFLSKRDIAGLVAYLQSDGAVPAIATVIAAATYVWGQWKLRHERAKLVVAAAAAPDDVAVVVQPARVAQPGRPLAPPPAPPGTPPPPHPRR